MDFWAKEQLIQLLESLMYEGLDGWYQNSANWYFHIFFLENRIRHFMQTVSLNEVSNLFLLGKKFKMSSAEIFTQSANR